jgi:hypothetical protein
MNPIFKLWANEPVVVIGVVVALMALLISFGVPLKVNQENAIRGFAEALGVLIAAYIARTQVSPVAKVP